MRVRELEAGSINEEVTKILDWVKELPFVEYGFVKKVLDGNSVVVSPVIQPASLLYEQEYTVTLLHLTSKGYELDIKPSKNDLVLLLSLKDYNYKMFQRPEKRLTEYDKMSDKEKEEENKNGVLAANNDFGHYTQNTLIGILLSTTKMESAIQRIISVDEEIPTDTIINNAEVLRKYTERVLLEYADATEEKPITSVIGKKRPMLTFIKSKIEKFLGFELDKDEKLQPLEDETPIKIACSKKAPIELDLQGDVNLKVGTDKEDNATEGKVNIEVGEKTSVTLKHIKGNYELTISEKGEITFKTKEQVKIETDKPLEIKSKDDITINTAKNINFKCPTAVNWQPNFIPTCPFGMPHGGQSAGITNLKGQ